MSRLDAIRQIGVVEQTYYRWRKNGAIESAIGPSDYGDGWNGRRSIERTEAASEGSSHWNTIGPRDNGKGAAKKSRIGFDVGQIDPEGSCTGKLLSPARRRARIDHVRCQFKVSERRACRVLGQHRSTQRHIPKGCADEDRLVAEIIELARQFGRYGYRRIAALLREAGGQSAMVVLNDYGDERGLRFQLNNQRRVGSG